MRANQIHEKYLILQVHNNLLAKKRQNHDILHRKVRHSVHECLGFAKSTISRVVAHYNADRLEIPADDGDDSASDEVNDTSDDEYFSELFMNIIHQQT